MIGRAVRDPPMDLSLILVTRLRRQEWRVKDITGWASRPVGGLLLVVEGAGHGVGGAGVHH